jgi:hypothetical protein
MDEDAWHDDWSKAHCRKREKVRVYEISMVITAPYSLVAEWPLLVCLNWKVAVLLSRISEPQRL